MATNFIKYRITSNFFTKKHNVLLSQTLRSLLATRRVTFIWITFLQRGPVPTKVFKILPLGVCYATYLYNYLTISHQVTSGNSTFCSSIRCDWLLSINNRMGRVFVTVTTTVLMIVRKPLKIHLSRLSIVFSLSIKYLTFKILPSFINSRDR